MGQKLHPETPLYNTAASYRISGSVNEAIFKKAFQKLIDSTDAFRIRFTEENGVPFQIVKEPYPLDLEVVDLSYASDDEQISNWLLDRTKRKIGAFQTGI